MTASTPTKQPLSAHRGFAFLVLCTVIATVAIALPAVSTAVAGNHAAAFSSSSTSTIPSCVSPFGAPLGKAHDVVAFSNCNDETISHKASYQNWTDPVTKKFYANLYTGMRWQCVEYSRRFMLWTQGVVFGDVEGASDMWNLSFVTPPDAPERKFALEKFASPLSLPNFVAAEDAAWPRVGDHVIYPIQRGMPFGHTCAVTAVERFPPPFPLTSHTDDAGEVRVGTVRIAEQNFGLWADPSYARELHLYRTSTALKLVDPTSYTPAGWIRARPGVPFVLPRTQHFEAASP